MTSQVSQVSKDSSLNLILMLKPALYSSTLVKKLFKVVLAEILTVTLRSVFFYEHYVLIEMKAKTVLLLAVIHNTLCY